MRSLLRGVSWVAVACLPAGLAGASSISTPYRSIFVRELSTPVTLQSSDPNVPPFAARLLWQFRSSRPRHLAVCVREPLPTPLPLDEGSSFSDLGSPAEAEGERRHVKSGVRRPAEDYMHGRLFLRPYNVAQLLTVLQGWSDAPAKIERPRSSLSMTAKSLLPSATVAKATHHGSHVDERPAEVEIVAQFTRKILAERFGDIGGPRRTLTVAQPLTDVDPRADEDYPDAEYEDDFFAIEHRYFETQRQSALSSQRRRLQYRRDIPEHSGTTHRRPFYTPSSDPPLYRSRRHTTPVQKVGSPTGPSVNAKANGYFSATAALPERADCGSAPHHSLPTEVPGTATTAEEPLAVPEGNEEYELVEEVEEMEEEETGKGGGEQTQADMPSSPQSAVTPHESTGTSSHEPLDTSSAELPSSPPVKATLSPINATIGRRHKEEVTETPTGLHAEGRPAQGSNFVKTSTEKEAQLGSSSRTQTMKEELDAAASGDPRVTEQTATTARISCPTEESRTGTTPPATTAAAPANSKASPVEVEGEKAVAGTVLAIEVEEVLERDSRVADDVEDKEIPSDTATTSTRARRSSKAASSPKKKKTAKKKSKKAAPKRGSASPATSTPSRKSEATATMDF